MQPRPYLICMGLYRSADTELVGDDALEEVEEALELEEDDGIKLEPFNLAQERQEGFFDEEGHYVEKRDKEEEEAEKDAGSPVPKVSLLLQTPRWQFTAVKSEQMILACAVKGFFPMSIIAGRHHPSLPCT